MEANNNKALREALEFIKLAGDDYEKYGNTKAGALDLIYEKACAALAEPPRNCDVGTAEEQEKRFDSFCVSHYTSPDENGAAPDGCDCPCYVRGRGCNCFAWAQMPYKEEGKK